MVKSIFKANMQKRTSDFKNKLKVNKLVKLFDIYNILTNILLNSFFDILNVSKILRLLI